MIDFQNAAWPDNTPCLVDECVPVFHNADEVTSVDNVGTGTAAMIEVDIDVLLLEAKVVGDRIVSVRGDVDSSHLNVILIHG